MIFWKKILIFIKVLKEGVKGIIMTFFSSRKDSYGYLSSKSNVVTPVWGPKKNVYIYENCGINAHAKFICSVGKFILKKNCSVGPNFTVITFNHKYNKVGQVPESEDWGDLEPFDVMVNEDVWIGANVTLCPGTIIGRGSIIAAGSVCIKSKDYPPYAIIGGNPAKFIKFRLGLDEQIIQENIRYIEDEQIHSLILKDNYLKFNSNK